MKQEEQWLRQGVSLCLVMSMLASPVAQAVQGVEPVGTEGETPVVTAPVSTPELSPAPLASPAPTAEITPTPTPELLPTAEPGATAELLPEPTPEAAPDVTPTPTATETPDVTQVPVSTPAAEGDGLMRAPLLPGETVELMEDEGLITDYYIRRGYFGNIENMRPDGKLTVGAEKAYGYFRVESKAAEAGEYTPDLENTAYWYIGEEDCAPFYVISKDVDLGRIPDQSFLGWYFKSANGTDSEGTCYDPDEDILSLPRLDEAAYDLLKDEIIYSWQPPVDGEYGEPDVEVKKPFGEVFSQEEAIGAYWTGLLPGTLATPDRLKELAVPVDEIRYAVDWGTVALVGGWEKSQDASIREATFTISGEEETTSTVTFYAEDLAGQRLLTEDATVKPVDSSAEEQVYYARVSSEVSKLSLSLDTFEPYYDYCKQTGGWSGDAPVSVSLRPAGETVAQPLTVSSLQIIPEGTETKVEGSYTPNNTIENPARSRWDFVEIPLVASQGGEAKNGYGYYNDIIITITAPDETTKITYTFRIQRLADPEVHQSYGNTPSGMIEREPVYDDETKAGLSEEQKEKLRQQWAQEKSVYNETNRLHGEINNGGSIYRGTYPNALKAGVTDFDNDVHAIVVYQNSAFLDPGFTIVDSQGDEVAFGAAAAEGSPFAQAVERRLVLKDVDTLTAAQLGSEKGREVYYKNGALYANSGAAASENVEVLRSSTDQVDLRGLSVLPGIYELEYIYHDPYAGKQFSSEDGDRDAFFEEENAVLFRRTLVVLPKPGDINMDGVVNVADLRTMEDNWSVQNAGIFGGTQIRLDDVLALVMARTMDLNNNGTLDADDLDRLRSSFTPIVDAEHCNYYYLPLSSGIEEPEVRTTITGKEPTETGKAKLTLEFLGTDPSGPDPNANAATSKVDLHQLFWVGLKLSDVPEDSTFMGEIQTMAMTLTYNSRYLRPADRIAASGQGFDNGLLDKANWQNIINDYNVNSAASGTKISTVWSDYDYRLLIGSDNTTILGAEPAREPVYDLTRPVTRMEELVKNEWVEELAVSIRASGKNVCTLEDGGYLLIVPFYLKVYPQDTELPLLEMAVGGRELALSAALTGETTTTVSAAFDAHSTEKTLWTQQDQHRNLRGEICLPKGLELEIPLGEDTTPHQDIYNGDQDKKQNAVYGEPFKSVGVVPFGEANLEVEGLPPGLTYHGSTRTISGVPTQAGTYSFIIKEELYRIVVEQAPLHIFAESKERYYGEEALYDVFNNTKGTTDYTFRYWPEDIKSPDRERIGKTYTVNGESVVATNSGKDADLPILLGVYDNSLATTVRYSAPRLLCYEDPTQAVPVVVSRTTSTGTYSIQQQLGTSASTTNYKIIYTSETGETDYDIVPGKLTIYARPIALYSFSKDYTVNPNQNPVFYNSGNTGYATDYQLMHLTAVKTRDQSPEAAPFQFRASSGAKGLEVTGEALVQDTDELRITFNAQFVQTAEDRIVAAASETKKYAVNAAYEEREVLISNVVLDSDYGAGKNYVIYGSFSHDITAKGIVSRRAVSQIKILKDPVGEYTYGETVNGVQALLIQVSSGFGSNIQHNNPTAYNTEYFKADGLRVCWVTPEEKAMAEEFLADGREGELLQHLLAGEEGTEPAFGLPYGVGDDYPLTVEHHNGRYLCIWTASNDIKERDVAVLTFSEDTLVVKPATLVLHASHMERYYGEETPVPMFTYEVAQLTRWDRKGLTLTGGGDELENVVFTKERGFDYTPPTVRMVTSLGDDAEPVTTLTPAHESRYRYITIEGASLADGNYLFAYSVEATPEPETKLTSWVRGYGTLLIHPRRVVLEEVFSDPDHPLLTLYADTYETVVTPSSTYADGTKILSPIPLTWTGDGGLSEGGEKLGFRLALPSRHTESTNIFYPRNGLDTITEKMGYSADSTAVVRLEDGRLPDLSLTFTVSAIPDNKFWAPDLTVNHFDMKAAVDGVQNYPAQISDVKLTGADAVNYQLVYERTDDAGRGLPSQRTFIHENYDDTLQSKDLYDCGYVQVALRPIDDIEILNTPKMEYDYGDEFSPDLEAYTNSGPMKVRIVYATTYDNDVRHNQKTEDVEFRLGSPNDSFTARGMWICYLPPDSDMTGFDPGQNKLPLGTPMVVTQHDGARLVVVGQREGMGQPVWSTQPSESTLIVHKRNLTLKALDQHRYYGEPNDTFTFTISADQLTAGDRQKLQEAGLIVDGAVTGTASTTGVASTSPALKLLDASTVLPSFQTEATRGSDVKNAGYDGYPLTLTGGSMANYDLTCQPGTIYIYRRPVEIEKFDPNNPIYTIFNDMNARMFFTNVSNKSHLTQEQIENGQTECLVSFRTPYGATDYNNSNDPAFAAQVGQSLKLSGTGVYSNDELNLRVQVHFYQLKDGADLPDGVQNQEVQVLSASLTRQVASAYNNYFLVDEGNSLDIKAMGRIELRNINKIEIISVPETFVYTYGDELQMGGLVVRIYYAQSDSEAGNKYVDVPYSGPDNFQMYGLYLNYYDEATPPLTPEERADLVENGRKADTGDHLTIAPTHDGTNFRHNGKYLVVSARLNESVGYMMPQMVRSDPSSLENVGTPITVRPLALSYTLEPADKTYDGQRETAGTLTLNNAFQQKTQLSYGVEQDVTDVVYIATGADYETSEAEVEAYLKANGHRFSTGSYTETPFENGLTYNANYDRETQLNFTFTDANVAYAAEPDGHTWGQLAPVTVETTNITLLGADRANYTIDRQVTAANVAAATGHGSTELPSATIHKADRATPAAGARPQVEVDIHTNTARIVYNDQQAVAQGTDRNDVKGDTLHVEYALQAIQTDETDVDTLLHVASLTGDRYYQDRPFFGGEFVIPELPEGYEPKADDLPDSPKDDEVGKGQTYVWAASDPEVHVASDAYPGGDETLHPGYTLYQGDRAPLERDTVYWGLVRLAETWNYKPSPALSSVEGMNSDTVAAVLAADPDALAQLKTEAAPAVEAAEAVAQKELAELLQGSGGSQGRSAAPAVKTYTQRLDLRSVEELTGVSQDPAGQKEEKFLVPTLEAVWFTDALEYQEEKQLDSAVRNDPKRYYAYYWDDGMTAEVFQDRDVPLDLSGPLTVTYTPKKADGTDDQETTMTVNVDNNATFYVKTTASGGGGGVLESAITISPEAIEARLGDEPIQLEVTFEPAYVTVRQVRWTTSDPSVATVDRNGLVTIVGVGECTITATSHYGRVDSITVTVRSADPRAEQFPQSVLRFDNAQALFELEDLYFHPSQTMTRGEVVQVLAKLYQANPDRPMLDEPIHFSDLEEDSPLRESVDLLSQAGVVTGVEEGLFAGDQVATRAEIVTMLARMIQPDVTGDPEGPHAFADTAPEDTWAWAYIDFMVQQGIVQGVGNDEFAPSRELTRAEAAAFLARLLDPAGQRFDVENYKLIPVDVADDYWSCQDIRWTVNDHTMTVETQARSH